jgi:hypothetical protein
MRTVSLPLRAPVAAIARDEAALDALTGSGAVLVEIPEHATLGAKSARAAKGTIGRKFTGSTSSHGARRRLHPSKHGAVFHSRGLAGYTTAKNTNDA